jgi:hypothetical protein
VRRRAAPEDQLGLLEPGQRLVQLVLAQRGDRGQQLVGEFPPDGGADLRHLLDRHQPVEARRQ